LGFATLNESLKELKELRQIEINLSGSPVTDEGLQGFGEALSKMENLESICIKHTNPKEISDDGLSSMISSLADLKFLKKLTLSYPGGESFCDITLFALAEVIKNMNLTSLNIYFSRCPGITDNGTCKIVENFKSSKELISLHLNFDYCNKLTQKTLNKLLEELMHLKEIAEDISLSFYNCIGISQEDLKSFEERLKKHEWQGKLELVLERNVRIKEKAINDEDW
jgi:hypothetical protein